MFRVVLTTLHAKFIHSSLALRCLRAYCEEYGNLQELGVEIQIEEFCVNQPLEPMIRALGEWKPDLIGFSCYLWNIELTLKIVAALKKIMPEVLIVLGGPEVSFDAKKLLTQQLADIVVLGEGEKPLLQVIQRAARNEWVGLENIQGVAFRLGLGLDGQIVSQVAGDSIALDEIPFAYRDGLAGLAHKIVYYESSRGCPNRCAYCLSSIEPAVKFLSLERTFADLRFFLDSCEKAGVRQIKFVDRTFNCQKAHALAIWKYLIEQDNGTLNFHFEISADLLDDEMIEVLKRARVGLFQFEIGVQSTNDGTLKEIRRKTDLERIFENVRKVQALGTIHLHLDLIAGLPNEGFLSFVRSFDTVYGLRPEQLQVGFLKLLKGSDLRVRADELGIVYREDSPYEVLFTKDISFEELNAVKDIETLVSVYYNSGLFNNAMAFLASRWDSPFRLYEELAGFWKTNGHFSVSHSKFQLYQILLAFGVEQHSDWHDVLPELLKWDMLLNENVRNIPAWCACELSGEEKERVRRFYQDETNVGLYMKELAEYEPRQRSRMCKVEKFGFDVLAFIESEFTVILRKEVFVLFHYFADMKSLENRNCSFTTISI